MTQRKYYTLVVRDNGRWGIEYGAHEKWCTQQQLADYVEQGYKRCDLRIVTTDSDSQQLIDAAVHNLNTPQNA